jgi:hypothetical protein
MPHASIQNLLRGQDTTAQSIREVILDHILIIDIGQAGVHGRRHMAGVQLIMAV